MKFGQCLPRLLLIPLCLLMNVPPVTGASGQLPARSALRASDEAGLSLTLRFDAAGFKAMDQGLYLALDGCALESADADDPRASGAPMLPVWRGLVALPPGTRPSLSWRLLEAEAVGGRPLPFPTPRAQGQGDSRLYVEELIEDPAAFARAHPIRVRLGEVRRLRDLLTVEVIAEPVGWNPGEEGLRLATELALDLRFRPDAAARAAGALREAPRRAEKHWDRIYAGALLNGELARDWKRRVPSRSQVGRSARAEASLKLLCAEDGLYGVPGSDLIAYGIAAGTPLSEIALYRHRFGWDAQEQPVFEQIAEPRYFLDLGATPDQLDAEDVLVFMGWRLRHEPESVDAIEWYGRACARYVAVAPALALPMDSEEGWSEEGAWTPKDGFRRRFWVQGENAYHYSPPNWAYNVSPADDWDHNLYYWRMPLADVGYKLDLPMNTPGYQPGTSADLSMFFQGVSLTETDANREFGVTIENMGGGCVLPSFDLVTIDSVRYTPTIPADCLVDGENTLVVDRLDSTQWFTYLKSWELVYSSDYVARDDSLHFHADADTGPTEIRVGGLSTGHASWQLVRIADGQPTRVLLGTSNETGDPGDYTLGLRTSLSGDESWWLAGTGVLRRPELVEAADIGLIEDASPADVLVIAHDDFLSGMEPWVSRRSSQGYGIKLIPASAVWDAFFSGVRSAVGMRNAARFAYQQWGVETLVLAGDANKDARGIHDDITGWDPEPDFLPVHSIFESVAGVRELVALEEWVVRWEPTAWPALLMGRLPVGSVQELEILLDKIECAEERAAGGACGTEDGWRKRQLLVADDCWIWSNPAGPVYCRTSELRFEVEQTSMGALIDSTWSGDLEYVPFNLSVLTADYYESHPDAIPSDLETYLRPIVSPVFIDSLSKGYLLVAVQSHANRGQVAHEFILKTSGGGHDADLLTNVDKPFLWMLFGCHGNAFAAFNEGKSGAGDCIGEQLLFADANRGAVASYASDGYEFLDANLRWERDWLEIMLSDVDPSGALPILPEWILGELQLVAELRFGGFTAAYRTNLLGDPLTRLDAGAPRLRLFVNEEEMEPTDRLPVQNPGDTLRVEALVWDETYLANLELSGFGLDTPVTFASEPRFGTESAAPLDSLAPMDTLAVQQDGRGRAWHLSARIPYDFALDSLVVAGTDLAGRNARLALPAPKAVEFYFADGEQLRNGQWVRPRGQLEIRILVPSLDIPTESFSLFVDGAEVAATIVPDTENEEAIAYVIELPYSWESGEHQLTVRYESEDYGAIMLRVDASTRLLDGRIFPNPFRSFVSFRFELTNLVRSGTLSVYTLSGRRIHREDLGTLGEGLAQVIVWDGLDQTGSRIANGVYIVRIVLTDLQGEDVIWEDKIVRMR